MTTRTAETASIDAPIGGENHVWGVAQRCPTCGEAATNQRSFRPKRRRASGPFGVFLGDDIIVSRVPCMRQLLDVFERHGGPVLAVMRIPREEIGRYGVIRPRGLGGNVFEVLDLVEKPDPKDAPSDLAIIGRYVLTPDLFPILAETPPDSRGEIQLTNGLRTLRGRRPIYAVEFEGRRHDTGEKLGFLKATVEIALSRPDLADAFRAYLKTLDL